MVFRRLTLSIPPQHSRSQTRSIMSSSSATTTLNCSKFEEGWWYLRSQIWLNLVYQLAEFRWVGNGVKDPASNSSVRSVNASPLKLKKHLPTSQQHVKEVSFIDSSEGEETTFWFGIKLPFAITWPPHLPFPVLHLFDHTDHTNHDQMAATYKENQEPRNDLANQCLQLIIRHRLPKRKHPNNPINEINSSNPPTGITPNGRLGIARRIGPNRCPKNFEPDAGFISMTSRRTIIYLCLYNVFFTSCTYISHICEYTSIFHNSI